MGQQRWWLRLVTACGVLLLFLPIEAYEPALALSLLVVSVAICTWLLRARLLGVKSPAIPLRERIRFRLTDLFWAVVVCGIALTFGLQLARSKMQIDYFEVGVSVVCFTLLSLVSIKVAHATGWKSRASWSLLLFASCCIAVGVHLAFVSDWLLLGYVVQTVDAFFKSIFKGKNKFPTEQALILSISFMQVAYQQVVGNSAKNWSTPIQAARMEMDSYTFRWNQSDSAWLGFFDPTLAK